MDHLRTLAWWSAYEADTVLWFQREIPVGFFLWIKKQYEDGFPLLDERRVLILRKRYRLGGEAVAPTLKELSTLLGVSPQRVRALEKHALRKLGLEFQNSRDRA